MNWKRKWDFFEFQLFFRDFFKLREDRIGIGRNGSVQKMQVLKQQKKFQWFLF